MTLNLLNVPSEVLNRVESFLLPSDCAQFSGVCRALNCRWNAKRWENTYQMHYGQRARLRGKSNLYSDDHGTLGALSNGRAYSFVGCCSCASCEQCNHPCSRQPADRLRKSDLSRQFTSLETAEDLSDSNIQFNVSSLLPSVHALYVTLWENIEMAMLGYQSPTEEHMPVSVARARGRDDAQLEQQRFAPFPATVALSDWMHVMLFMIGLKPMAWNRYLIRSMNNLRGNNQSRNNNWHQSRVNTTGIESSYNNGRSKVLFAKRRFDPLLAIQSSTTSMSAWKLACILKERGIDCIRCRICNKIDLGTSPYALQSSDAWIRPCDCSELVHRRCLEEKLGLVVDRLYIHRRNRLWLFYDDAHESSLNIRGVAEVDENNRLTHPKAKCTLCGTRYGRSVRLPYGAIEVLLASLVDPLSLARAFSTFVHFLLCCLFIAGIEGMYQPSDLNSDNYLTFDYPPFFALKWPNESGWQLAGWQLQQCLMLHIFLSPRFAAIVDRLWFNASSRSFYCRLYVYFVLTSLGLSVSLLPYFRRFILRHMVPSWIQTENILLFMVPAFKLMKMMNFLQYTLVSTMVVCIFWRTNIRIFTIADKREEASWQSRTRRHSHPIYHGQWENPPRT